MNAPTLHRGRLAKAPRILSVRPLTREDLGVLREKRAPTGRVKQLRETHRRLAMLIAAGFTTAQVVETTGYSTTRILQLKGDPAFMQLVAEFRPHAEEIQKRKVEEFYSLLFENGLKAERMIGETLDRAEEDDELIPINRLLAISRDSADRVGHGKHTSQTTKVVDFAKMIEVAQAARGNGPVIDARANTSPRAVRTSMPVELSRSSPQADLAASPGIRRRL